jgi:putative ATP-binding cassette transporter
VGGVLNYAILYYTADFTKFTPAEISEFINYGSFTTLYLIGKLSDFVQIGSHVTGMTAHASRIAEFCRLAEERDYIHQWETAQDREVTVPTIMFSSLDIVSPDEQCHIEDFDLRIEQGRHVYITGPNGSGKTSLVRILMRLWKPTRGRVAVLGNAKISCAPQEPIIYSGTLLEQLGLENDCGNNDEACRILMAVNLASLPFRTGGMSKPWPRSRWMEMLSPGEMQRLVLARVLLESPHFAILDEATSAVDMPTERIIYEEFWKRKITTITIGHRMEPALMEQIDILVTLDGNGGHVIRRKGEELVFGHTGRRSTPGITSSRIDNGQ